MRFKDKVCLVTGGGSGIGKATCTRFASEGAHVLVIDLNEQHGRTAADTITKNSTGGGDAIFAKADVSNPADIQAAIQSALNRWEKIDVVVNDAAMMTFKPVVDLTVEDWDRVQAVNMRSVFLFCKHALPHMSAGGAFVNISSVHAHETTANVAPYAASKGAMEAFTRAFSFETAKQKVRVNCVAPGAVNTPMLWNNPNVKSGVEKVPGAVGEPEDIA